MSNINGINSMSSSGMDPNQYAQKYATANGISLSEAKSQLKAKYGDPNPCEIGNMLNGSQNGPKNEGDYDPISHKSNTDGTKNTCSSKTTSPSTTGPQKAGDYDPISHKSNSDGSKNTCSSKTTSSSTTGPQKAGDYDPVSHKSNSDGSKNTSSSTAPTGASDPETYAKQICLEKYGDTQEAHMKTVRAELKAQYGDPQK